MLRVGLTGNIGSGKSTVCRLFEDWGATVVDADDLAREAVAPGSPVLDRVREVWGDAVIDGEGGLDRAAMRRIVFSDSQARSRLESLIHPIVRERLRDVADEAEARGDRIFVAAVPLLFEASMQDRFDLVVLVDAPLDHRVRWLVSERGLDREEVLRMDAAQQSVGQKRRAADLIIDNTLDIPTLERRAWETWKEIEKLAGAD